MDKHASKPGKARRRAAAVAGVLVMTLLFVAAPAPAIAQDVAVTASTLLSRGNLTVSPLGDIVFAPGGKDVYPSTGYDTNLGLIGKKFLQAHIAELWAETLVAQDTLATVGGRILVGATTQLTADVPPAATTITVKHNNLANGDTVYLEAGGQVEFLAITSAASGAGPYTYTVTRNLDASGANAWYAGDAVFNTGTTGSGFMDLYSLRGVKAASEIGPSIVGNVRTGTTWNAWAPRWAVGNLNGVYGYGVTTYGAAFGDATGAWLGVDATNGVRGMSGATERFHLAADGSGHVGNGNIYWDTSGNLFASGWEINAAAIARDTGTNSTSSGMAHADYPFYAGATYANRASAPFRVTRAGAVTASNAVISGSFSAGSGTVSIDGTGITLATGSDVLRWGTVGWASSTSYGFTTLYGANSAGLTAGSQGSLVWNGTFYANTGGPAIDFKGGNIGTSSSRWGNLYIDPPSTTAGDQPIVYSSANHKIYVKTDGVTNGSWNCGGGATVGIALESGIIVGLSCTAPAPSPAEAALQEQVAGLQAELQTLKAMVAALAPLMARQ